jgi:hypothetical protein
MQRVSRALRRTNTATPRWRLAGVADAFGSPAHARASARLRMSGKCYGPGCRVHLLMLERCSNQNRECEYGDSHTE